MQDQKTARDLAVEVGAWECVAMLDGVGKQLRQAAIEGKLNRTLGLLSNEGCDVNDVDQDSGDIALHHAAQGGWSAVVRALCHHGANPNAQNLVREGGPRGEGRAHPLANDAGTMS